MKETNDNETAVAVRNEEETAVARPASGIFEQADLNMFCTFTPKTAAEKAMLYKAMTSPTGTIKGMINKEIQIAHVFARGVEFAAEIDEKTGEIIKPASVGTRIAIITPKGESYVASAKGVKSALTNLFAVYGFPDTWDGPITVIPKETPVKKGNLLTFDIEA